MQQSAARHLNLMLKARVFGLCCLHSSYKAVHVHGTGLYWAFLLLS